MATGIRCSRFGVPKTMRRAAWLLTLSRWALLGVAGGVLVCVAALALGRNIATAGQIAYLSRRSVVREIRVLDLFTGNTYTRYLHFEVEQLAGSSAAGWFAATARDGDQRRMLLFDADIRQVREVPDAGYAALPAWSPDGSRLALQVWRSGNVDLYRFDVRSGSMERLTDHPALDGDPAWSPDGERLVFRSTRSGYSDLYILEPDGSVRQLTNDRIWEERPAWSPDGTMIAYSAFIQDNWELFVFDLTTNSARRLTDHPARDHRPSWSPDSRQIAFESTREGWLDVYILDLASGQIRNLTRNYEDSFYPVWLR